MERYEVVRSLSGRDKDTLLAVVDSDDSYVYVCDGKARPLDNPKRKNPRHVAPLSVSLEKDKLTSDRSLRKALAILKDR